MIGSRIDGELSVWNSSFAPFLVWDQGKPGKEFFSEYLTTLLPEEAQLDDGRYAHFRHAQQRIIVPLSFMSWTPVHHLRGPAGVIPRLTHWIGEHCDRHWSMRMDMQRPHEGRLVFSFDDEAVAVLFALKFL